LHRHAEGAVLEEVSQQVEGVHSSQPRTTLVAAATAAAAALVAAATAAAAALVAAATAVAAALVGALVGALFAARLVTRRGALEQRRHGVAQHRVRPAIEPEALLAVEHGEHGKGQPRRAAQVRQLARALCTRRAQHPREPCTRQRDVLGVIGVAAAEQPIAHHAEPGGRLLDGAWLRWGLGLGSGSGSALGSGLLEGTAVPRAQQRVDQRAPRRVELSAAEQRRVGRGSGTARHARSVARHGDLRGAPSRRLALAALAAARSANGGGGSGGGARGMLARGWRRERERASLPNQQRGLLDHPA